MDIPTPSAHDDLPSLMPESQISPDCEAILRCGLESFHAIPATKLPLSSIDADYLMNGTTVLNPVPLPQPRQSQVTNVLTPPTEPSLSDLALASFAAPALPPNQQLQRPSLAKSVARNFRLPSFESLGIASPHPDQLIHHKIMMTNSSSHDLDAQGLSDMSSVGGGPGNAVGGAEVSPVTPVSTVLASNPPDVRVWTATPPQSQQSDENQPPQELTSIEETIEDASAAETGIKRTNRASSASWIADVIPQIVASIRPRLVSASSSQIRILTHSLPLPSVEGYCYPRILSEVHASLSPQRTTWISHWHAVSGRFNLSQLPTTPPTTPAAPGEGEDYFTTRVFDSAVAVPDYQQPESRPVYNSLARTGLSTAPPSTSPRPAVPPFSVEISITERYIPPSASSEFMNLFDPTSGRSLISDRLVELSEDCGSMVLIYATRNGGRTFVRDYLGRVLDPLLRRMMIVRQLGVDVCERIGRMSAVEDMPTFEEMKARIAAFCERISSATRSPVGTFNKFTSSNGTAVDYSVVLAHKNTVALDPDVWSDWWCRQEKSRIRNEFDTYLRLNPGRARGSSSIAGNIPPTSRARMRDDSSSEVGSMSYILEVMEGVKKGAKDRAALQDSPGIEVGVFVIRKDVVKQD